MYQGTVPVSQILGDQSGNLYFGTSGAYGNSSVSTKLTLGTAGDLTIADGNLVVASGHGIDFSATGDGAATDTSELFADYEEGDWTPLPYGVTTSGSAVSYTHLTLPTNREV